MSRGHHAGRGLLTLTQEVEAVGVMDEWDIADKERGRAAGALSKASGGAQDAVDAAGAAVGCHGNPAAWGPKARRRLHHRTQSP